MGDKEQAALHNEIAGKIVGSIIIPVTNAGGSPEDVFVLLESVIIGVFLYHVRIGGDEAVFDTLMEGVKTRLAEIRLKNIKTKGEG